MRRYAGGWAKDRGQATAAAYVPLSFAPGEAYQFDWSHEVVLLNGATGEYQEFRARGRFSSLADEPFAEHDGELGLGLEPFARRPFPFVSRVVQNQI